MLFGFKSKKKQLEEKRLSDITRDLFIEASVARELANGSVSIKEFVKRYDEMVRRFSQICEISKQVSLKGALVGDPRNDYRMLQRDRQLHTRAALQRHYDHVIKECETKYLGDYGMARTLYEAFTEEVESCRGTFDDETSQLANDLIKRLRALLSIDSAEGPTSSNTASNTDPFARVDEMSGPEFEQWCAAILRKNGFSEVETCGGSGDQGVDIVATKDGIRYAIQCKCYSSDLGNTPVQEIHAGKDLRRCHVGVVLTNRYFTKGAIELAEATGTLLWDRDKLREMQEPKAEDSIQRTAVARPASTEEEVGINDPLLWEAAAYVVVTNLGTVSGIQRRVKVGYARAGRIMDTLEEVGIVGPSVGSLPREVLVDSKGLALIRRRYQ